MDLSVMNGLPFKQLSPYKARSFVPNNIDLGKWDEIYPLFDFLESRFERLESIAELEKWLLDWGELRAALDEESSLRYILMTCHTDDAEAERAYLEFVEKVDPELKPRIFKLETIYLDHPLRAALSSKRYEVFDRNVQQHVELFNPDNVSLEKEETILSQKYQKLCGSFTVAFQGKEYTLEQMARFLEEPDRQLRQKAWELIAQRRLQACEELQNIFDAMLELREKIATNANFPNFLEYSFKSRGRFDYTPQDCLDFHNAVEQEVVPLLKEIHEDRRKKMKLSALRPWDLAVDPLNRPPLRPFSEVRQLMEKTQKVFNRLCPDLAQYFQAMQDMRLLDLDNRKGKAPGGYQCTLGESRLPFIFMNAVGTQRDVETIMHEAGHAFHAMAARHEDFYPYREAPIEFCEVASMSMELLGNQYIESFYAREDAERARREHLESIVEVFPWIATVDAFQHWIYTHPRHTRVERNQAWSELMRRFGGLTDWTDYDAARDHLWHKQLHIFIHPFYYIEYGIAQIGALQIWERSKKDLSLTTQDYLRSLSLGGSKTLPDLFEAAGCRFKFDRDTLRPLMQSIRKQLFGVKSQDVYH